MFGPFGLTVKLITNEIPEKLGSLVCTVMPEGEREMKDGIEALPSTVNEKAGIAPHEEGVNVTVGYGMISVEELPFRISYVNEVIAGGMTFIKVMVH